MSLMFMFRTFLGLITHCRGVYCDVFTHIRVICAAPPSALMLQSAHAINSSQPAIQQLAARERDPFSLSYDVTYVPGT